MCKFGGKVRFSVFSEVGLGLGLEFSFSLEQK